jgi:hypothetical protein
MVFNRSYRIKYTDKARAIELFQDVIVQWHRMAGESAKESVFESRVLLELYRACSSDEPEKAEAFVEQARQSLTQAVGPEHPAILDFYFAKIELLVNQAHTTKDHELGPLA